MRARRGALVAVALLAAACDGGSGGGPLPGFGPLTPSGVPHQAAAGLPRDEGTVDLVSGATTVAVRTADLGAERVRAVTPDGPGWRRCSTSPATR